MKTLWGFCRAKGNQFLFILICLPVFVTGQVADDTLDCNCNSFPPVIRAMAVPSFLVLYGLGIQGDQRIFVSSQDVKKFCYEHYPRFSTNADDYLVYSGPAFTAGLTAFGIKGKHKLLEQAVLFSATYLLTTVVVTELKQQSHVRRPDNSNDLSMPSGHTASAFAGATAYYLEYKDRSPWYGVPGYIAAGSVGAMRILNNKHWASDVLVGAGVGILMTRLVYWSFDLLKNRLHPRYEQLERASGL